MRDYRFDCSQCSTRCDGVSKGVYLFENDVDYSERQENFLINQINGIAGFCARKCTIPGAPDIEVFHSGTGKTFYIEVKAQRRTFMSIERILPNSDLVPSETLCCNLSDILRYFSFSDTHGRVFVLWCLENRPCVVQNGTVRYFYQDLQKLRRIYDLYGDTRKYRRQSGRGDVVNGQHKGVVVNYHFSISEFDEMNLNEMLKRGIR